MNARLFTKYILKIREIANSIRKIED